ncbi:hypothetical protein [Bradyrhizobium sp.]|uniref:hypothetical protein n=1 Tax=Bradyrhizobium sp. TaxID=376 RepID=UPI003C389A31
MRSHLVVRGHTRRAMLHRFRPVIGLRTHRPGDWSSQQGNRSVAPSPISPETEERIELLFPPDEHKFVRAILLEQCGNNLPLSQNIDEVALERLRFAALKLSEGTLDKLDHAIALAKSDWRDLLTAAGFGRDVNAHWAWLPERKYLRQRSHE